MSAVPNELQIIINTNIPGLKSIIYSPSLSIPDIKETNVIFNPLVKLNKALIEKMPSDYRVKQFFSNGLFESLIVYNNVKPVKDMKHAKYKGVIDNNIRITLDILFSPKSILYINKNPYTVIGFNWQKGDWSLTKIKKDKIIYKDVIAVTIDMELFMGKNITQKEFKEGQCQLKWNAFRKSYSALIGNTFNIKPNYTQKGGKSRRHKKYTRKHR